MAATISLSERGRIARISCFTFEKAISIGLRSGEYGGKYTTCAPVRLDGGDGL